MEGNSSRTALATAHLSAAHQLLDAKPAILQDDAVLRLLGPSATERIQSQVQRYQTARAKALRSHVVLRSRYAEDRLAFAVQRGIRQYVILGAGFDTFALRQPSYAASLRIVEVDHPASQAHKLARMQEAQLALPANASLAPLDFERESLPDCLGRSGVSSREPTFFSWLGVSMYLQEAAVVSTLRSIASFSKGSELVFTFLQSTGGSAEPPTPSSPSLTERVAAIGEPFLSHFEPDALAATCLACGFSKVAFLSSEEARDRYYFNRPPDLPVPEHTDIVSALL